MRKCCLLLLMLVCVSLLASCAAPFYLLEGKGQEKAAFTLPKEKRILVFVDLRQGLNPPPDFTAALATKIADHLFKFNAGAHFVSQDRLSALQHDPETFSHMGVADIVRACDADLAIYVDVVTLNITSTTDKTLSGVTCQCLVKVIDSNGVRMWPTTESSGTLVSASIEPNYTDSRTDTVMMNDLEDLLTVRTGRLFHPYSREDPEMNK